MSEAEAEAEAKALVLNEQVTKCSKTKNGDMGRVFEQGSDVGRGPEKQKMILGFGIVVLSCDNGGNRSFCGL